MATETRADIAADDRDGFAANAECEALDEYAPDDGDRDGNFDGKWARWVRKKQRELELPRRRRWAYLEVARRARSPHAKLTSDEYRLLCALVEKASQDLSNAFPSVKQLGKQEIWKARRIRYILRRLETKQWIKRHKKRDGGGSNGYQFMVPACAIGPSFKKWEGPIDFSNARAWDSDADEA